MSTVLDRDVSGLEKKSSYAVEPRSRRTTFYTAMAVAMSVVVFLGFGPSFYLRAFLAPRLGLPPLASTLVWVHGFLFSGWMLVLLAQTALVRSGQVRSHRRLGVAGAVLAAAVALAGTIAQIAQTQRVVSGGYQGIDVVLENALTIASLLSMVSFATLIGAALLLRARPESHKRLMILATVQLLGAATGRIGGNILAPLAPSLAPFLAIIGLVLIDVFIAALIIHDLRSSGRVHRATIWGSALILLLQSIGFTEFYPSATASAFTVWVGRLTL